MTNTQTAAPGVAVEATIAGLMQMARGLSFHSQLTEYEYNQREKTLEAHLRTALLAGAAGGDGGKKTHPTIATVCNYETEGPIQYFQLAGGDPLPVGTKLYTAHPPVPVRAPQGVTKATRAAAIDELNRQQKERVSKALPCDQCNGEGKIHHDGRDAPTGHRICIPCQGLGIKDGWRNPAKPQAYFSEEDISKMAQSLAPTPPSAAPAEPKYDPRMMYLEKEKGTLDLRIEGLSMREIKDLFEDKYGELMWSEGCAYPCDGVKLKFTRADFAAPPPGEVQVDAAREEPSPCQHDPVPKVRCFACPETDDRKYCERDCLLMQAKHGEPSDHYEAGWNKSRDGVHELFVHEDAEPIPGLEGDKPLCRFVYYVDDGDASVGEPGRAYWALAPDQSDTELADLLAKVQP